MSSSEYKVLVIGAGPIGMYSAFLSGFKGLNTCLIESTNFLGGQPLNLYPHKSIYDFPGLYGLKAYQVINNFEQQLRSQKNVDILLNTRILKIEQEKNKYVVDLNDGQKITTDFIIIATGMGSLIPRKLEIPLDNEKNIDYLVKDINKYKNKKVIILGGGDSAVDWANELAENKICSELSIIHRNDQFRAKGENVDSLKTNKVNIVLNAELIKIQDNKLFFKDKITSRDYTKNFDYLIVQFGILPNNPLLNLFPNLNADSIKRILVDISQKTNLKNIYAIGNVCTYPSKPYDIVSGCGEASVAIRDILTLINSYS